MVAPIFYAQQNSGFSRFNPLAGINWLEMRQAYQSFLGNPTQGIMHILAAGQQSNWQHWVEARLARQAAHLPTATLKIDIAALSQLPEETLGSAYARHIIHQGFDPEAFVRAEDKSDLGQRLALSHDVYHVIVGFDGSVVGEFGLAAFVLVQYRDLLNVFVLSHLPWFMLGHLTQVPAAIAAVIKGLWKGFTCQPIIAYPFEAHWQTPLSDVRRELGLQ